jgi:hypothetical protein
MSLRAQSWDHTGYVWQLHDAPIPVIVDPTMPEAEEWLAAFQYAADVWTAATPTALTLSVEMADSGPLSKQYVSGHILVYGDLKGWVGDGIPAVEFFLEYSPTAAYTRPGGSSYLFLDEVVIEINSDTEAFVDIDEACEGDDNIREIVALHELGHALGMGNSCEDGWACDDELLADAVMYWDDSGCTANRTPNEDDVEGLGFLYDAAGWWFKSGDAIIGTQREECFAIAPNDIDADHVEWDFGEGATVESEGDAACHTFQTAGELDVEVRYFSEPDDEAPRSWSETILVCPTPPDPIAGAEHLFYVDTIGTQIEIHPTVDARLPCVESLSWSVVRNGETLFADRPTSLSLADVGEYGEYTVVLRASGPGGGREEQTITLGPEEERKSGCSTAQPRGGLALLGLVIAALCRRRTALTRPESGRAAPNSSYFGAR